MHRYCSGACAPLTFDESRICLLCVCLSGEDLRVMLVAFLWDRRFSAGN